MGRDLDLDEHLRNGERLDSNVGPEGCVIGELLSDGLDDGFLRDGAVRDGERGELTDVQGDECQSAMGSNGKDKGTNSRRRHGPWTLHTARARA